MAARGLGDWGERVHWALHSTSRGSSSFTATRSPGTPGHWDDVTSEFCVQARYQGEQERNSGATLVIAKVANRLRHMLVARFRERDCGRVSGKAWQRGQINLALLLESVELLDAVVEVGFVQSVQLFVPPGTEALVQLPRIAIDRIGSPISFVSSQTEDVTLVRWSSKHATPKEWDEMLLQEQDWEQPWAHFRSPEHLAVRLSTSGMTAQDRSRMFQWENQRRGSEGRVSSTTPWSYGDAQDPNALYLWTAGRLEGAVAQGRPRSVSIADLLLQVLDTQDGRLCEFVGGHGDIRWTRERHFGEILPCSVNCGCCRARAGIRTGACTSCCHMTHLSRVNKGSRDTVQRWLFRTDKRMREFGPDCECGICVRPVVLCGARARRIYARMDEKADPSPVNINKSRT